MKRLQLLTVAVILLLSLSSHAVSQKNEVTLGISESGARRITLALPPFRPGPSPGMEKASQVISDTLRDDLAFSGFFNLVNPKYYSYVTGYSAKRVQYKD